MIYDMGASINRIELHVHDRQTKVHAESDLIHSCIHNCQTKSDKFSAVGRCQIESKYEIESCFQSNLF